MIRRLRWSIWGGESLSDWRTNLGAIGDRGWPDSWRAKEMAPENLLAAMIPRGRSRMVCTKSIHQPSRSPWSFKGGSCAVDSYGSDHHRSKVPTWSRLGKGDPGSNEGELVILAGDHANRFIGVCEPPLADFLP
jgi:hypothetical protein